MFWGLSLLFALLDHYSLLSVYRINGSKYPDKMLIHKALKKLIVDFILNIPFNFIMFYYWSDRGITTFAPDRLPSVFDILTQVATMCCDHS